jgi:DNA-binding MarR family transcriptional regulator
MSQTDRVESVIAALEREVPRLDYSAKAIAARLVRLGTVFIAAIERVAARFGLSANEYVILCVLRGSGRPFRLPPKAITPLMPLSSGGMTNILHGLAARGLIERLPDPSDGRGVLIQMTADAVKLIDQAIAAHVDEEHLMVAALAPKERRVVQKLLSKLLLAVDPVAEPVATRLPKTRRAAS